MKPYWLKRLRPWLGVLGAGYLIGALGAAVLAQDYLSTHSADESDFPVKPWIWLMEDLDAAAPAYVVLGALGCVACAISPDILGRRGWQNLYPVVLGLLVLGLLPLMPGVLLVLVPVVVLPWFCLKVCEDL